MKFVLSCNDRAPRLLFYESKLTHLGYMSRRPFIKDFPLFPFIYYMYISFFYL